MRRYIPHIALALLVFVGMDLLQSGGEIAKHQRIGPRLGAFIGIHLLLMGCSVVVLVRDARRPPGLIVRMARHYRALPIPLAARTTVSLLLLVLSGFIVVGKTSYPFADVGMFRWVKAARDMPPVQHRPVYYFKAVDGTARIVHIRKQHIWAMADLLGWGWNNEYTFSANYLYKGLRANHDFLLAELKRTAGVDTLWVGLASVDFRSRVVSFDPDPIRAVMYNDTAEVFYGPLFIPDHQRAMVIQP